VENQIISVQSRESLVYARQEKWSFCVVSCRRFWSNVVWYQFEIFQPKTEAVALFVDVGKVSW